MLDVDVEACARGIFILTRSKEEETSIRVKKKANWLSHLYRPSQPHPRTET